MTPPPLAIVHRPGCAKPDVRAVCDCGANVACRTCGWGKGTFPCACYPIRAESIGRPS